jgi:ATP-dependent protease Clp ATPase subunit
MRSSNMRNCFDGWSRLLLITDEAIDFIVDKALEYKLGARGLRLLCDFILTDAMYELPVLTIKH